MKRKEASGNSTLQCSMYKAKISKVALVYRMQMAKIYKISSLTINTYMFKRMEKMFSTFSAKIFTGSVKIVRKSKYKRLQMVSSKMEDFHIRS